MAVSLAHYLERYWNGISYLDTRDYRAHYPDITEIVKIMFSMDKDNISGAYVSRAEWLMSWLDFEQLSDGGFLDQKYENPKKSAATTPSAWRMPV